MASSPISVAAREPLMDVPAPTAVPDEPTLTPPVTPSRWIEIDRRTFLQGTSATAVLLTAASAIARAAGAAAPARPPVPVLKPEARPVLRPEAWDDGTLWDDGTGWIP